MTIFQCPRYNDSACVMLICEANLLLSCASPLIPIQAQQHDAERHSNICSEYRNTISSERARGPACTVSSSPNEKLSSSVSDRLKCKLRIVMFYQMTPILPLMKPSIVALPPLLPVKCGLTASRRGKGGRKQNEAQFKK